MKKYLATLLALIMIFTALTVIAPVGVFAADADDDDIGVNVPDDAFDGGYVEFKGKDGSVTRVFDNGSVSTKYKDGSYAGVDYKGNQYAEDKKGNYTVHTTDGYIATEYKDGRRSLTEPNGKTTTVNTDDSFSESYATLGVTVDYDADGHRTGIGFTGSSKRIETDEDGYFQNGELKGKGGQTLVITDDGAKLVDSEGTEYNFTSSLNKEEVSIKWKDGAHCESTTTTTWNNGERTENTDFSLTESNGDRWDANCNATFDKDGNPQYSTNNVTQFTGTDGSTLWIDNNSKAVEFRDPNTGSTFITDKNGNLLENKSDEVNFKATYDDNGNLTSADITWKDGARQVQNADGSATFTAADGTKYESDGKGNVYKNGKQIKKDGEWAPGEEPEATASTTSTATKELWKEDAALLRENGYDVTLKRDFLFEDTINAPRGSVTAFISAVRREDGSFIKIWYFKEESQASSVASPDNEQAGIRIVQGDKYGIITGKTTDTGDGLAQMNKDAAKLESLGFRVDVYTSGISDYETAYGVTKGSLLGYLRAFRSADDTDDSILIQGYYFKTKADAQKCQKNMYSLGVLVDYAVIRGDEHGYITGK